MATIRDIAKICRVSPTTVSLVLNNRAGQVSEKTRRHVLQAVRDHDYKPRSIRTDADKPITRTLGVSTGLTASDFSVPGYVNSIFVGLLTAAEQQEINVTLLNKRALYQDEKNSIRAHIDGRCDGVIVIAPPSEAKFVRSLDERGIPFVLVGDQGGRDNILSVDVDNLVESKRAMQHLIDLGHRRIAFGGGPDFVRSASIRRDGYKLALAEAGLPYNPAFDACVHIKEGEVQPIIYEWTRQVMRLPMSERPTAFFCWNDSTAVRTLMALSDRNIRVPQHVSVVGFDDSSGSATTEPRLTTFRQPYSAIGAKAVELLLRQIRREEQLRQPFYLPADLILRDSTAAPPPEAI